MASIKGQAAEIINNTFQGILVAYLLLLLIEQIWKGAVSAYFNLNYLLIAVIVLGILDVFSEHKEKKKENPSAKDYMLIGALSILGFGIIKYKIAQLGWLSWVISIIAGILIALLSYMIIEDEEDEETEKTEKKTGNAGYLAEKWGYLNFRGKVCAVILISIVVLLLISIILSLFTSLGFLESLRIVFGSIYVLFIPGFIISYIFFPKTKESGLKHEEKGAVDWIERIALSFALSIAIVPLAIFYFNLVGIKINFINSFLTIAGIIVVACLILVWKSKLRKA